MPRFLHHGLIMKSPTQKLSKADRDTSVGDLRAAGLSAAAVIGRAALAGGLLQQPMRLTAADAQDLVSRSLGDHVVERLRHRGVE